MKIGIMTFWWSDDNYGQILQCYALQKYLRNAGHDAYLIRYDPRNDYEKTPALRKVIKAFNPVKLVRYIWYKIKKRTIYDRLAIINTTRNFEDFREKYIKQSEKIYFSYQELLEDPPESDMYIVGSDQVWNPDFLSSKKNTNRVKAYFLDFGDTGKKQIAYAASFGKEQTADDFIREITPLLKKFDYVSVREKSGVDICRQCGVKAEWVPDPTMLLNADDYRILFKNEQSVLPGKPYLFLYLLGNKTKLSIKAVYQWAKEKKLEVVYVSGNAQVDNYKKVCATIPQWISLIDNAEYVLTNSFHGCVFSLIFQKPFIPIMLTGKDVSGMNTRLTSLFELCELKFDNDNQSSQLNSSIYDFDENRLNKKLSTIKESCKLLEKVYISPKSIFVI
jgi:hypothetical protein